MSANLKTRVQKLEDSYSAAAGVASKRWQAYLQLLSIDGTSIEQSEPPTNEPGIDWIDDLLSDCEGTLLKPVNFVEAA